MYLDANGIVLGKTNLGELQSGFATNPTNLTYGITTALNPYNPIISPSGKPACHQLFPTDCTAWRGRARRMGSL